MTPRVRAGKRDDEDETGLKTVGETEDPPRAENVDREGRRHEDVDDGGINTSMRL